MSIPLGRGGRYPAVLEVIVVLSIILIMAAIVVGNARGGGGDPNVCPWCHRPFGVNSPFAR